MSRDDHEPGRSGGLSDQTPARRRKRVFTPEDPEAQASLRLRVKDCRRIAGLLSESGGGSGLVFCNVGGHPPETWDRLRTLLRAAAEGAEGPAVSVCLSRGDWRAIYGGIHAAVIALGPFELPLVAGTTLVEVMDVQLRLCSKLWGAYGGLTWAERPRSVVPGGRLLTEHPDGRSGDPP